MTIRMDGKLLRDAILDEIKEHVHNKRVAFVQMIDDPVTEKFVQAKIKIAESLEVACEHIRCTPKGTADALDILHALYKEPFDGIVLQLPLPETVDKTILLSSIPTEKDIDLLNEATLALFRKNETKFVPPVASAILAILNACVDQPLSTKKIAIIGKGLLVGKPVMELFDKEKIPYDAFDLSNKEEVTREALSRADIVITGIGNAGYIKKEMIKDGVVLIDAGTSEQHGMISGDIDEACYEKASFYTPVPGGVGPVTIAELYKNLSLT